MISMIIVMLSVYGRKIVSWIFSSGAVRIFLAAGSFNISCFRFCGFLKFSCLSRVYVSVFYVFLRYVPGHINNHSWVFFTEKLKTSALLQTEPKGTATKNTFEELWVRRLIAYRFSHDYYFCFGTFSYQKMQRIWSSFVQLGQLKTIGRIISCRLLVNTL